MNRGTLGKSSKETESIDEKNLSAKRLKGSNLSQKNTEIPSKQSEITRIKTVGVHRTTGIGGPVISKNKNKLRSPTKLKPISAAFQPRLISQPPQKSEKRPQDLQKPQKMKVQQDSAETAHQSKKKDAKSKSKIDDNPQELKESPPPVINPETNGKDQDKGSNHEAESKNNGDKSKPEEITASEKESVNCPIIEVVDLSDDSMKLPEVSEKPENLPQQIDVVEPEKEASIPKTDGNTADDLVESTTSESSPVDAPSSQAPVNSAQNDGDHAKNDEDPSFVSYDSSIMLKDVKIKLNDCLRDNSKLMDVTDPNASMSEAFKDLSFGRTLRSISGRNSIGRLRHVTVRDRQLTPNDSLFVNTSTASINTDDVLRYTSEFLDSSCRNGTPMERKRKIITDINDSAKKIKREESSILNTSWEYLRNLRRPVQVSTPNPKGYKFDIDGKSEGNDGITTIEQTVEPKKWCVVM